MRKKQAEYDMFLLVNKERNRYNLPLLQFSDALSSVAFKHSVEQLKANDIFHESSITGSVSDRLSSNNVLYTACGENVAVAPSMIISHKGLMNSHGHRANILSNAFRHVGIGIAYNGTSYFTTQVFAKLFVKKSSDQLIEQLQKRVQRLRIEKSLPVITILQSSEILRQAEALKNCFLKDNNIDNLILKNLLIL